MAKYTNSVPLGQEGTGAATILGPSRALQHWLGVSQRDQHRLQSQQDRYQQTQASYNQQFAKDINETVSKSASPLWSSDLNKYGMELASRGGELRSKGINPYSNNTDPEYQEAIQGWRGDANQLLNFKAKADEIKKWQASTLERAMNDKSGGIDNYRKEDIDAVRNIDKNFSFQDLMEGKVELPSLQPKIDFQKEALDSKFNATTAVPVEVKMPDGGVRMETKVRLNTELANAYMDNAFREGTAYAKEVEGRLRDAGIEGSFGQLLGTTDKEEVREYVDSYLRSPDESNPVVDLMAKGSIPAIDTPEYEKFLSDAVNEQLKAEKILEQSKKEFFTGLQVGVKEEDKLSYSYVQENLRLRKQAAVERRSKPEKKVEDSVEGREHVVRGGDGVSVFEIKMNDFIDMPVTSKPMASERLFNVNTGKEEALDNVEEYTIVGVGRIDNPPKGAPEHAALVQVKMNMKGVSITTEYLKDAATLPKNLKKEDDKLIKASTTRFKKSKKNTTTTTTKKFTGVPAGGF